MQNRIKLVNNKILKQKQIKYKIFNQEKICKSHFKIKRLINMIVTQIQCQITRIN